jgi:4,5-dihydroxyphthalate decarboxylase
VAKLRLRYAGVSYFDKSRALERGEVAPEGIELEYVQFEDVAELFRVVAQDPEAFDAAEMSTSTLTIMVSRGDDRLVGIPVFTSKAFRHSQVYVNTASGIERPEDLAGKRVGVPEYQMTAAVWIRAFLQHDYGVHPGQIHWLTGGLETPDHSERLHHDPPPGVTIELIPPGTTLEELLGSGGIDALATARQPRPFREGASRIRRLFPDYRAVEEEYLRRTGIYPIMHTVVLQRRILDANPGAAVALADAFEEARHHGRDRLRDLDTLAVMHPWIAAELEELKMPFARFGGDPFAYGLEANRHVLEALMEHAWEQGLPARKVEVDELFAPETLDWRPAGTREEVPA